MSASQPVRAKRLLLSLPCPGSEQSAHLNPQLVDMADDRDQVTHLIALAGHLAPEADVVLAGALLAVLDMGDLRLLPRRGTRECPAAGVSGVLAEAAHPGTQRLQASSTCVVTERSGFVLGVRDGGGPQKFPQAHALGYGAWVFDDF
jgi:hypothetical protein